MPIYEYRCVKCSELFEVLVMSTDSDEVKCPKCEGTDTERVMSTTHYSMPGGASDAGGGPSAQTRTCSGGSCTTYDIPGPR